MNRHEAPTRHARRKRTEGFTIVELLVVSLLGSLLMIAVYNVLVTNQRTYSVQAEQVSVQQRLRATMDVLTAELREISPEDITLMNATGFKARSMDRLGFVCQVTIASNPVLRVVSYGVLFADGDTVAILADNDPGSTSDDVWIEATVTDIDSNVTCGGGRDAQDLTFGGQEPTFTADSVRTGGPIRGVSNVFFSNVETANALVRASESGKAVLVTPVNFSFEYFDENGDPPPNPESVAEIRITATAASEIQTAGGTRVADTLVASVYPRN